MPVEERDTTIDDFRRDIQNAYSAWLVDNELHTTAGDLCRLHRLRAYDAAQLAHALAVREDVLVMSFQRCRMMQSVNSMTHCRDRRFIAVHISAHMQNSQLRLLR